MSKADEEWHYILLQKAKSRKKHVHLPFTVTKYFLFWNIKKLLSFLRESFYSVPKDGAKCHKINSNLESEVKKAPPSGERDSQLFWDENKAKVLHLGSWQVYWRYFSHPGSDGRLIKPFIKISRAERGSISFSFFTWVLA